ncbi:MFS, DHA1 sub-family [Fistulina hepatica ATCC 64428]|nr:MFS, DHA1 sub-family [Fistulina hepatica ATCC 64428]
MAKIELIVFLSLVLDLFAFTIPLPLFPRIIEWFAQRELGSDSTFLAQTLAAVSTIRSYFYQSATHSERWDIVLLGGLMGSVFSTLQFLVSPIIGSLSDKYGRRRVLLVTMVGNILSALVWIKATSFATYMVSRVVGGLSEGNVQLATAILSDVSPPERRSAVLAYVGIAFAICFIIGPPVGAYFASVSFPHTFGIIGELNIYAVPALLTLVLLIVETTFLYVALPETRGVAYSLSKKAAKTPKTPTTAQTPAHAKSTAFVKPKQTVDYRLSTLRRLRLYHFMFLAVFSGVEFTLTFLTFDLFDWSNKQNGMLIGGIGIVSALLQGGYVRRAMSKTGEGVMARRGVISCVQGLVFMALIPYYAKSSPTVSLRLLQAVAVCLGFTSATVVSSLTAAASLLCDDGSVDSVTGKPHEEHPDLAKGKALGVFRSSGQLGRALGPLLACASYWTFGPSYTYATSAATMFALWMGMESIAKRPR